MVAVAVAAAAMVPASVAGATFPASGDNPVWDDYHWNCPGGIHLTLGGGGGYRQMAREWVNEYHRIRAAHPTRANWPYIVQIHDLGWDGNAAILPCQIDVDERWELEGGAGGIAWLAKYGDQHSAGSGILLSGRAWAEQPWNVRRNIPYHELYHAIGLGHDGRDHAGHAAWAVGPCRWSVMGPVAEGSSCLTDTDVLTLEWTLYNHRH